MGFFSDIGNAFQQAVANPISQVTNAVEKAVDDPTKLNFEDVASIVFPVGGALTISDIKHPEDILPQAGIALGASFALEGSTILKTVGLKTAATPTPGISGPLYAPSPGFGASTSNLNLAAAGKSSIAGVPTAGSYAPTSTLGKIAAGFSTKNGSVGLGDALVNGISGIVPILGQTAPLLFLSQMLGGKGGVSLPGVQGSTFGINIPQGIRDAASNFLPSFGGRGNQAGAGEDPEPIQAGFSPFMIFLLVGVALGMLSLFYKKGRK